MSASGDYNVPRKNAGKVTDVKSIDANKSVPRLVNCFYMLT